MTSDRGQVAGPDHIWPALLAIIVAIAVIAIVGAEPSATVKQFDAECEQRLGGEWSYEGYFSPEPMTLDHYDVQCKRSTGLLKSEVKWITIPKENVTIEKRELPI